MSTAVHPRRIANTGRPLGMLDVFSKIAENASAALRARVGSLFTAPATDPATRRAIEAAALRRFADLQRRAAPGFAADLYAAADRHDQLG